MCLPKHGRDRTTGAAAPKAEAGGGALGLSSVRGGSELPVSEWVGRVQRS
jgi:hypothetical protein